MNPVLFALDTAGPAGAGELSDPFPVLKAGKWNYGGRKLAVTVADLDHAIDVFNTWRAAGRDVSIDYDHSFAERGDSKAAGWYRELTRDGDTLMARVEWTDEARDLIARKVYRYFSAEFHPDYKTNTGETLGFTMLSGALTNRPFLPELGAVALSETARDAIRRAVSHVSATTDDRHGDMPATATSQAETVTLTASEHQALTAARDELASVKAAAERDADKLTVLTETVDTLKGQVATLTDQAEAAKARADESEARLLTQRIDSMIAQARRDGKLDTSDATTEKWTERARKWGVDDTEALLADLPRVIPVGEIGHGQDQPANVTHRPSQLFHDLDDRSFRVDEHAARLNDRAATIAREKNIPFAAAVQELIREGAQ